MMLMLQFTRVSVRVTAKKMVMGVASAAELPIEIKQAEQQERGSGDAREPVADPFVQRDPKPRDQDAERGGDKDVTGAGKRGDAQRL